MGIHFTVTVDHDIRDTSLEFMCDRFKPLKRALDELGDQNVLEHTVWRDVSEPGSERPYLFYTPGGFTLQIGIAALRMHHFTRFSTFVEEPAMCDRLRQFSRQLAGLFHCRRALYAPCEGIGDEITEWVRDGLPLSGMEAGLRLRGSPPPKIGELADCSSSTRYYIDEFRD